MLRLDRSLAAADQIVLEERGGGAAVVGVLHGMNRQDVTVDHLGGQIQFTYAGRGFVAVDVCGRASGLGNGNGGETGQDDETEELVHFVREGSGMLDLITRRIVGENW